MFLTFRPSSVRRALVVLSAGLGVVLPGCKKNSDSPVQDCKFVNAISTPAACYNPGSGLTLTAGYAGTRPLAFEWGFYDQPDTVRGSVDLVRVLVKRAGTDTFTVPDSLLNHRNGLGVTVNVNCDGDVLYSTGFVLVKRQVGGCARWVRKF